MVKTQSRTGFKPDASRIQEEGWTSCTTGMEISLLRKEDNHPFYTNITEWIFCIYYLILSNLAYETR